MGTPDDEALLELEAEVASLREAQERHLRLIRDLTQAPLPEDCIEARNRVGVLTAKCATLRRERDDAVGKASRYLQAMKSFVIAMPRCAAYMVCRRAASLSDEKHNLWCDRHAPEGCWPFQSAFAIANAIELMEDDR